MSSWIGLDCPRNGVELDFRLEQGRTKYVIEDYVLNYLVCPPQVPVV